MSTAIRCKGRAVAASSGIVIGRAHKVIKGRDPIPERHLPADAIDRETARLQLAVNISATAIDLERDHLRKLGSQDPLLVLDAHRMMIDDPELIHQTGVRIRAENINAEWALRQQMDAIQEVFRQSDNAYLRGRLHDVEQIGQRILNQLMGQSIDPLPDAEACDVDSVEPLIYIGEEFSVSDIVRMWRQGVAGIITEQGGADAHNIIVARGIGLPSLVGATGIMKAVKDGCPLILDGETCRWISNPSTTELETCIQRSQALSLNRRGLAAYASQPSLSKNGHEMKLMANIEFIEELDAADGIGIDGIGLFRSEFLFINCTTPPDEERQFSHYRAIIRRMAGKPVTIRLLDIGGDKAWLYQLVTDHHYGGANPALGLRGVRLLLRWPQLLETQLRALLRAGEEGPLHILVPMVTCHNEMAQVRQLAKHIHTELGLQMPLSIGAMIEVPAAVLIADSLAQVSDFFSIGTNDLIQYTLATDRSDEEVASLYQPDHPAIQQLIRYTATAAKKAGIPLSVCGELAAHPEWTAPFLNMDMYALSMSINSILPVRRTLSHQVYKPTL
ncbi:MAG: phosphoenolpyruvate--protein phosphotransferase [Mariprofundus sp.]